MYITLKASDKNESSVQRVFAPFTRFFDSVMEKLPEAVEDIVANIIAEVFEAEGGWNEWTALAEYTEKERVRLGYYPRHPILVREGTYRGSFIDFNSPFYVSEHESTVEGSFIHRIGTSNPLFPYHEQAIRIPKRAATPVGDPFVYEVIVQHLNEYLNLLLEESLHA